MGDPLLSYLAAADVLTCARAAIAATPAGAPDGMRAFVVAGKPAWEGCCAGQLTVSIDRIFATSTFPQPDLQWTKTPCGTAQTAMDLSVVMLRCSPVGSRQTPPTAAQLDGAARVQAEDALAIWRALRCCLAAWESVVDGQLRQQIPVGPEGGCVGSATTVTLGLHDYCECDETAEATPLGLVALKTGTAL